MNNKGFTLIELLTVISLMAIMAMVALPAIDNALKEGREKLDETQKGQIIKGAKGFLADNIYCLPGEDSSKCKVDTTNCPNFSQNTTQTRISISCLQNEGYLPVEIANIANDSSYGSTAYVLVTKSGTNNYTYEVKTE